MERRGFTLIELMVVIAIIAVLAGIAWPSYVKWQERDGLRQGVMVLQSALSSARSRTLQQGLACGRISNPGGSGNCNTLYFGVAVDPSANPQTVSLIRFCDDDGQVCNGKTPGNALESDEVSTVWSRDLDRRVAFDTGSTTFESNRILFSKAGGVYGEAGSAFLEAGGSKRCVVVNNGGRIKEGRVNGTDCD